MLSVLRYILLRCRGGFPDLAEFLRIKTYIVLYDSVDLRRLNVLMVLRKPTKGIPAFAKDPSANWTHDFVQNLRVRLHDAKYYLVYFID